MSSNFASDIAGATVTSATSHDERFPGKNILDGNDATFWATTGTFPQEIIVRLPTAVIVSHVRTVTTNVKKMVVEYTETTAPSGWKVLYEKDLPDNSGGMQVEKQSCSVEGSVSFLKFRFEAGWDDFATFHRVDVEGSA